MNNTDIILLSRLNITGLLNIYTPYIVIQEIGLTIGLNINIEELYDIKFFCHIITYINNYSYPKIKNIELCNELINYINPLEKNWTSSNLIEAYNHIKIFDDIISSNYQFENYSIYDPGLQTNNNLYTLNSSVLYGFCKLYKLLPLPSDITLDEMRTLLIRNLLPTTILIQQCLNIHSIEYFKRELSLLLLKNSTSTTSHLYNNNNIIYNLISSNNPKELLPKCNKEAILLCSYNYGIDITQTKDPFTEYAWIQFCDEKHIDYNPIDELLLKYRNKNKNYGSLLYYFNPYLPEEAYSKNLLQNINYVDVDEYEIYYELQLISLQETFYPGWLPNIENLETPINCDLIEDIKSEDLICFGILNEKLYASTWLELYNTFSHYKSFINPFQQRTVFPISSIKRLLKISLDLNDTSDDRIKLADIIQFLLTLHIEDNNKIFSIKNQYEISDKISIQNSLIKLYELSLYMRGWDGQEQHPIYNVPVSDAILTENRSLVAIVNFEESCKDNFILSLPLILWKEEYVLSQDEEQGLTIGDRLNIIKNGLNHDNTSSCIRLSSNTLLITYIYYCKLFDIIINFRPNDVHQIF
jgi:hypothetical protein